MMAWVSNLIGQEKRRLAAKAEEKIMSEAKKDPLEDHLKFNSDLRFLPGTLKVSGALEMEDDECAWGIQQWLDTWSKPLDFTGAGRIKETRYSRLYDRTVIAIWRGVQMVGRYPHEFVVWCDPTQTEIPYVIDLAGSFDKAYKVVGAIEDELATTVEHLDSLPSIVTPVVEPIPMLLTCIACGERHIDEGEFATKPHHTHACQHCGTVWRPAIVPTVGVRFLPGFKNKESQ